MTGRRRAADVMDWRPRAAAGGGVSVPRQTLGEAAEDVRREARSRFRGFVLDRVNPGSRYRNRSCLPLDRHLFEEAADLGLLQLALPTEIGGGGRDRFDWGVVVGEVARMSRDPGFAVLLDISVENTELILSSGRPELTERYVSDLVAGRRFAVQAAYESRDPYDYETTAREERGTWVLNGGKRFVAGAVFADLFVVYARDEASNDILAFVVEAADSGVAPTRLETMGLRSMGMGQLLLHDVRLPEWRLLWRSDGLSELNTYARGRRLMTACGVLGATEAIVEACVESLATRVRSGRRVLDYPNVERSVGELRVLLETSRSLIYRALDATRARDRDAYFDELATAAKHQVSDCALRVAKLVLGLQGGEGYMSARPWEQYVRDVVGLIGGQGSQELLLLQLGQRSIVALEGRRLREDGARRSVARLADAWWALSALAATRRGAACAAPAVAGAVTGVLAAAGLDGAVDAAGRRQVDALLDRGQRLLDAAVTGQLSTGPLPTEPPAAGAAMTSGRQLQLAAQAWGFAACTAATRTGLLRNLVAPLSATEAARRSGLPEPHVCGLLSALVEARVVKTVDGGRYVVDPGLEPLLTGGPRASAFAERLDAVAEASAELRGRASAAGAVARYRLAARGHADALVDVLFEAVVGRLVGLDDLLDRPGARIGCAASDGGHAAAALVRHVPVASVLAVEPDDAAAARTLAVATACPADRVDLRHGDVTDWQPADRLSLAWLPAAGHRLDVLRAAAEALLPALVPGGWVVVACPLAPRSDLGAAVLRLELACTSGTPVAAGEAEDALRSAGLSHVHAVWDDPSLGVRLVAGRRP